MHARQSVNIFTIICGFASASERVPVMWRRAGGARLLLLLTPALGLALWAWLGAEQSRTHDGPGHLSHGRKLRPVGITVHSHECGNNSCDLSASDMPLQKRVEFQKAQVDKFCQTYNLTRRKFPHGFNRHILADSESESLVCYAPKAGCTNIQVLFYLSLGLLPNQTIKANLRRIHTDTKMRRAKWNSTLAHMPSKRRSESMTTFFKFLMFRNPLDRLVSAYRDKVGGYPLIGLNNRSPDYNWVRKEIYRYNHPKEYAVWQQRGGRDAIRNISFSDFVKCWLDDSVEGRLHRDEHFTPITEICHPCLVRYDFYGKFRNFGKDVHVLIDRMNSTDKYLRQSYWGTARKTEALSLDYYRELSTELKLRVFHKLAKEIDFYYHIFPEETGMHKKMLGIENSDYDNYI